MRPGGGATRTPRAARSMDSAGPIRCQCGSLLRTSRILPSRIGCSSSLGIQLVATSRESLPHVLRHVLDAPGAAARSLAVGEHSLCASLGQASALAEKRPGPLVG